MLTHRRQRATKPPGANPGRPEGCGGTGPTASLRLLEDDPHRLRRRASPLALWRSQRGPRDFCHGLLAKILYFGLRTSPGHRAKTNCPDSLDSLHNSHLFAQHIVDQFA